jgi:hypothetical protein
MKGSLPNRDLVRQYLLGRLDDKVELEADLSERILFDDDLSEMVNSVEDEIIEEYLDGVLISGDRDAVDGYFLRPTERKEKLRFARLLRHYFDAGAISQNTPRLGVPPFKRPNAIVQDRSDVGALLHLQSYFRTYGWVTVLILLGAFGVIYISDIRESQTQLEGKLVQERERSASLMKKAQLLQASMVPLTLVSDRSRSAGEQIPQVEVKPSTQRIIVDIALPGGTSGPCDVRLEGKDEEGPIWSARLLPIVSPSGDARLVFDLPTHHFASGIYSFVVSSSSPTRGPRHYDFQATVTE